VLLRDPHSRRCVVCKRVRVNPPDRSSDAEGEAAAGQTAERALSLVTREVTALQQLRHPHIITYIGSYQLGGSLCILTG
jgi:hypothetical protein